MVVVCHIVGAATVTWRQPEGVQSRATNLVVIGILFFFL